MRIVLADDRQPRSEQLRRILLGEGLTCDAQDAVGYDDLPGRLAGVKADLVLVAMGDEMDAALAAVRTAHQLCDAPILVAAENATVPLMREAMRAGAHEFLELGRLREELSEALVKIDAGGINSHRGNVICLYSPSGGVGVSTTAVNLAVRLAGALPEQVALVDLKRAPSDLSLLMDIEPGHTLDELCIQWDRLDRKLLDGAMVRHGSGVHVLAQAGYPEDGRIPKQTLSRQAVRQLVILLRRMYPVAVLDLDHSLDEHQIEAMRLATFVGLIVRADVPGLRRARWALDAAGSLGISRDRFRLVLGRSGQRGQIEPAKVEEILGIQVFQAIPDDHSMMNRAVNRGVPLAELSRMSRISRSFSSFARSVQTSAGSETA